MNGHRIGINTYPAVAAAAVSFSSASPFSFLFRRVPYPSQVYVGLGLRRARPHACPLFTDPNQPTNVPDSNGQGKRRGLAIRLPLELFERIQMFQNI